MKKEPMNNNRMPLKAPLKAPLKNINAAPSNIMKTKLFGVVFIVILFVTFFICAQLFNTSVIKAEEYRAKANAQQLDDLIINANRGTIYDRNGKTLALSKTVWKVILSPYDIDRNKSAYQEKRKDNAMQVYADAVAKGISVSEPSSDVIYDEAEEICRALAEILDVDYDKYKKICDDPGQRYVIVKQKVEKAEIDKLEQFKKEKGIGYYCLYMLEDSKRYYPNDSLASNVIGFTNFDNEGIYGIEAYYDDFLQGVNGRVVIAKDASGNTMPHEYEMRYPAQNGNSLVLTIDEVLQHYLEKNLATTISQHKVNNRATGIIMNAKTGAILAMATSHSYDLNNRSELSETDKQKLEFIRSEKITNTLVAKGFGMGTISDLTAEEIEKIDEEVAELETVYRETQWKNKAISELYFPGSVFKVITCASAIEEQKVDLNSSFFCPGSVLVSGETIHCWTTAGHGSVNLTQAITKSCNPSFVAIGQLLGASKFSDYFEAFGFTQKTGIDLPGEAAPYYMHREDMGLVELASSSFGQTNKITPIQMICAYAAAINGGYLVTPYLVDKILDNDGNVIKSTETNVKRQVVSAETSELMQSILENVVKSNGGSNAYIAGYSIGGKSGTTEKLDEPDYKKTGIMRYVSTFCAFTPADDPEIIMLVCVDDPRGGSYYGSAVAAPVVSAVFKECLPYLEIYPQFTAEEQEQQDTFVPYLIDMSELDTRTLLNTVGLNANFKGEESGNRVLYTVPQAGQAISKNGTVVIYMSEQEKVYATVPDVYGMSVSAANTAITNAGLNIKLSGGAISNERARAQSMSISPGESVPAGTVIEVSFVVDDETG